MSIRRTSASSTDATLTCGRSSGSFGARWSLAHQAIDSHSRMRRWPSRLSRKTGTCSRRFSPFATRLQDSAARRSGRSGPQSRTRRKSCCLTARRRDTIVARTLGLSERTLTRKLAEEGTTYEQVVDRLRQSLALQYIKERDISLSQVAWLLGYEGSTSFNHAFKRWTGVPPSIGRSEKLLPASV